MEGKKRMKKIKNVIKAIKDNFLIRVIIELLLGTLLFNINNIIALTFVLILIAEVIFANVEEIIYIYIYLSFFDEVLQNKYLGGSISRIIMVVIAIKLIFNIIKNKIKISINEIGILSFFAFSFIISLLTYKTIKLDVLIILFNILLFVLFSINIKMKDKKDIENFIENLFFIIVIAVINCIIYGLINNSFLKEIDGANTIYRFKGTYEPNFMSLFINLGIISILAIKGKKINKKLSCLLCAVMININILTVSITGLTTMLITLILYLIFKKNIIKVELKDLSIIAMLVIVMFPMTRIYENKFVASKKIDNNNNQKIEIPIPNENPNVSGEETIISQDETVKKEDKDKEISKKEENNLKKRLNFLHEILKNGNLDRLLSGRPSLFKTFIKDSFNRPLINILFGNDITTKKIFVNYFNCEKYSHTSYVDILYNCGIIGFIISFFFIFYKTIKNKYLKFSLNDNYYKNDIKLVRIMLLIFALALSLYTKRMILVFFLL